MAYILNIETSTKNCSVTLSNNGAVVICLELAEEGYSHAEKLHVFFEEVLFQAGITFADVKAIAVSQGPGSYTGLRIGVSAAKGLCYALGIPLIAIDTLETLARQINIAEGVIVPMIDARRMEVFTAFFDKEYHKIRETQAEIIDENTYADTAGPLHLIGDGAAKCKASLHSEKFVYHDAVVYPSSADMSRIAFEKYSQNDFVSVAYFEPFYLKDFLFTQKIKA